MFLSLLKFWSSSCGFWISDIVIVPFNITKLAIEAFSGLEFGNVLLSRKKGCAPPIIRFEIFPTELPKEKICAEKTSNPLTKRFT